MDIRGEGRYFNLLFILFQPYECIIILRIKSCLYNLFLTIFNRKKITSLWVGKKDARKTHPHRKGKESSTILEALKCEDLPVL